MTKADCVLMCLLHNEVFETLKDAEEHVKTMLCSAIKVQRSQVDEVRRALETPRGVRVY